MVWTRPRRLPAKTKAADVWITSSVNMTACGRVIPASGSRSPDRVVLPGLLHDQVTDGYNVAVDYTHLFSGSMLAEFHFGRTSVNIDQGANFANATSELRYASGIFSELRWRISGAAFQ